MSRLRLNKDVMEGDVIGVVADRDYPAGTTFKVEPPVRKQRRKTGQQQAEPAQMEESKTPVPSVVPDQSSELEVEPVEEWKTIFDFEAGDLTNDDFDRKGESWKWRSMCGGLSWIHGNHTDPIINSKGNLVAVRGPKDGSVYHRVFLDLGTKQWQQRRNVPYGKTIRFTFRMQVKHWGAWVNDAWCLWAEAWSQYGKDEWANAPMQMMAGYGDFRFVINGGDRREKLKPKKIAVPATPGWHDIEVIYRPHKTNGLLAATIDGKKVGRIQGCTIAYGDEPSPQSISIGGYNWTPRDPGAGFEYSLIRVAQKA